MSIAPHTILRPFGAKPVGSFLRQHARLSFRASSAKAVNWEKKQESSKKDYLEVLCDDGFGSVTMKDYMEEVRALPKDDGGPPRWFCPVDCGRPLVRSAPLLLFLPGLKEPMVLEWSSFCITNLWARLLQVVDESVKYEHALSPKRQIFVIGDSLGGCLAISVAALNPKIDLVLILINPATSFTKIPLQAILPLLDLMPSNLSVTHPHLLRYLIGEPLRMAMVSIHNDLSLQEALQKLSDSFNFGLNLTSESGDILRMDNVVWKLKLLKSGAAYANSCLHAVQAEVLLLASGNENLPPSGEADRLFKTLKNCKVRYFRNRGHSLLMDYDFNLLNVIKGVNLYRRGRKRDIVIDFLPPTLSEFKKTSGEDFKYPVSQISTLASHDIFIQDDGAAQLKLFFRPLHQLLSRVMLSTMETGKIVRGLAGVPDKGPILFVGYHQLLALEKTSIVEGFLEEKKVAIRILGNPLLFSEHFGTLRQEFSLFDYFSVYGAVPISPINMYKLFQENEFVVLYPGGVREVLHRKGEGYHLFWPEKPEFVRMAARFGVTIIPFGCVGEDDFMEIFLDYNEQKRIPYLVDWMKSFNEDLTSARDTVIGEDENQVLHVPGILPKVPGRLYFLFGKPIVTKGMDNLLSDSRQANDLYLHTKSGVEKLISYLRRKREEDPYRSIVSRTLYQATWGASAQVPTFEP